MTQASSSSLGKLVVTLLILATHPAAAAVDVNEFSGSWQSTSFQHPDGGCFFGLIDVSHNKVAVLLNGTDISFEIIRTHRCAYVYEQEDITGYRDIHKNALHTVETMAACCDKCQQHRECVDWVYKEAESTCRLKMPDTGDVGTVEDPEVTHGKVSRLRDILRGTIDPDTGAFEAIFQQKGLENDLVCYYEVTVEGIFHGYDDDLEQGKGPGGLAFEAEIKYFWEKCFPDIESTCSAGACYDCVGDNGNDTSEPLSILTAAVLRIAGPPVMPEYVSDLFGNWQIYDPVARSCTSDSGSEVSLEYSSVELFGPRVELDDAWPAIRASLGGLLTLRGTFDAQLNTWTAEWIGTFGACKAYVEMQGNAYFDRPSGDRPGGVQWFATVSVEYDGTGCGDCSNSTDNIQTWPLAGSPTAAPQCPDDCLSLSTEERSQVSADCVCPPDLIKVDQLAGQLVPCYACQVPVAVTPRTARPSQPTPFPWIIIVVIVLALVLLGIIILLGILCRRRVGGKKSVEDEPPKPPPAAEQPDAAAGRVNAPGADPNVMLHYTYDQRQASEAGR